MLRLRQSLSELVRLIGEAEAGLYYQVDTDKVPQERAIQLLKQNLSPAQREQYERRKDFDVTGCDTGRRYRIRHGIQLNVEHLDHAGRRIRLLCFMPEGCQAVGDVMLAQKIALELFENEALKIAHKAPTLESYLY
jgi:hypothetical protein